MSKLQQGLSTATAICAGFIVAYFGVAEHDELLAQENDLRAELAFGDKDSPIEMYLFSDWACPACRKLESKLDTLAPVLMAQGRVYFVDHAIHPETLNFTPYHLSFMLKNKDHYLELREALTEISDETKAPTEDQVEEAVSHAGAKYYELDYSEVATAIRYFKKLGKKYNIKGTPTLVIINKETKKGKKLKGTNAITEKNVLEAINKISA